MARDVSLEASGGLIVVGWHAAEDGLLLRVRSQSEEVRLRCACGRCHWIVREVFGPEGARLLVSCHSCGRRQSFLFEGTRLPTP